MTKQQPRLQRRTVVSKTKQGNTKRPGSNAATAVATTVRTNGGHHVPRKLATTICLFLVALAILAYNGEHLRVQQPATTQQRLRTINDTSHDDDKKNNNNGGGVVAAATIEEPLNEKTAAAERPPMELRNMIQIGANDGIKGNNNVVAKILKHPASRAILVEGNPSVFRMLEENVRAKFDATLKRIVPRNALICENGESKVFYSVDAEKLKAARKVHQLPHWVEYQIGSLDKSSTLGGLEYYLEQNTLPATATTAGALPPTASDFVREDLLECVSLSQLLLTTPPGSSSSSGLRPHEVQVLAVDVEGYDANVVLQSFDVPGLEPELIVFEVKSAIHLFPSEFRAVMETLHQRGYETTNCFPSPNTPSEWKCGADQDVWARKKKQPPPPY